MRLTCVTWYAAHPHTIIIYCSSTDLKCDGIDILNLLMWSLVRQAVGIATRWAGGIVRVGRTVASKLLAIHPFLLGINIYCYLMSAWEVVVSWHPQPIDTAMSALRRINFMKQVQLLEHLDEQGLRMLLNALPAWVKARTGACTRYVTVAQQFSDYERANFLNHALTMLWPAVDAKLSMYVHLFRNNKFSPIRYPRALRSFLEEIMSMYAPSVISGARFEHFSFGKTPITILGVKDLTQTPTLDATQLAIGACVHASRGAMTHANSVGDGRAMGRYPRRRSHTHAQNAPACQQATRRCVCRQQPFGCSNNGRQQ